MGLALSVLLVEDSESDAALVIRQLEKAHYKVEYLRVETAGQLSGALENRPWDVVISDFKLPSFSAPAALVLLQETGKDIPFIVVSGTIGEETAVELMRSGAHDYLMKDKLTRLASAVQREIIGAKVRSDRRRAEASIREMLEWQEALFEGSRDAVFVTDGQSRFVAVNRAACLLTGYSREELLGLRIPDLHDPVNLEPYERFHKKILDGEQLLTEAMILRKDGRRIDTEFNNTRVVIGGSTFMHTTARDVSERKRSEQIVRQQAVAMNAASDGMAILDADGKFTYLNQAHADVYGFARPEDLIGLSWEVLYDKDELDRFRNTIMPAFFAIGKWQGEAVGYRTDKTKFPQDVALTRLDGGGIVCVVRDTAERKRAEETKMLQTTALESTVNGVIITDHEGTIVWVNKAFTTMTGYDTQEAIGRTPRILKSGKQDDDLYRNMWASITRGEVWNGELTNRKKDGTLYEEEMTITPVFDRLTNVTHFVALKHDVSERKRAQESLRQSEERFRSVWDNSADGMRLTDREGRIIDVNPAFCSLVRMPREQLLGKILSVAYQRQGPDDDLSLYHKRFDERETISNLFGSATLWNGESIDLHISSSFIEMAGRERLLLSLFRDVTEQKKAERHLEEERNLLRTILDAIPDEVAVKDMERRFVLVNPGTVRALKKKSEDEIIGKRDEDLIPEAFAKQSKFEEESVLASGRSHVNTVGKSRIDPATGEVERSILISKIPLKDSSGKVVGLVGINRDITEVQRVQASLEKERTLLFTLLESIPDEICLKDTAHRFIVANSATVKSLGARSLQEVLGKTDSDFVGPELAQTHMEEEDAILESGHSMINQERIRRSPLTGEIDKCLLTTKVPVQDQAGKKIGILVVNRYITERKKAEEALRGSESKFRMLFEESKDAVYFSSVDGRLLDINAAGMELFGFESRNELMQINLVPGSYVDPDRREQFKKEMELAGFVKDFELRLKRKGGEILTVLVTATAVRDKLGHLIMYRGMIRDVTRQRLLELQFMQAQKMESIGTLAGGIAHDFNNILGIVLGHLALLERTRKNDDQFEESILSITKAVERGASLVRQILTFARKTDTQFEPVNINLAIKELTKMLEETLPKSMTVTVRLDKSIPAISMDPTQLHQALLNLCVNARDAMNGRGNLVVASKLVPGSEVSARFSGANANYYVHVSVADTGSGMDEETKKRIFEPFYTTKEKGKGTGLGLAVVYGVLRTHNGFVDVESTQGTGSTFHLYFPVPEGILVPTSEHRGVPEVLSRGTETILVVEDEDILRDLLVKLLEMQGYKVIPASDGDEAVRRFEEHSKEIDLVLSDMGLPKRSGWDAIRAMQVTHASVRALLASGYLDPGQKSEVLKSGVKGFIQKPYKMEEVLRAIREVLDTHK